MNRYATATALLVLFLAGAVGAAPCDVEALFASPLAGQTIEQRLIDEIDAAEEQILIAMYSFTSDDLGAAVIRAYQRGVNVYVLLDEGQETDEDRVSPSLAAAGVPTAVEHQAGVLHHRFAVIDRRIVITGSYDWADAGDFENAVVIDCAAIAAEYIDEFAYIANDLMGLGWSGLALPLATGTGDPCQECLARLNESTESDFAECPGVDTYLAFRLELYRPYSVYYCSQAAIETVLLGVPGLNLTLARDIIECICEGLFD
mgnify:CR=1 FL=1